MKCLGAVDTVLDLIIGTKEWALPAHTFTNYSAMPTATRRGIYKMQNIRSLGEGGDGSGKRKTAGENF